MTIVPERECEHLKALKEYLIEHDISMWGCGCCGSPTARCHVCDVELNKFNINEDKLYEEKR